MKRFFQALTNHFRYLWMFYMGGKTGDQEETTPDIIETPEPAILEQEPEDTWEEYEEAVNKESDMNKTLIILDNGHGEETPGKRSPWSACNVPPELPFREYSYTRNMVEAIAKHLTEDGYPVHILVPEARDVSLAERVKRINTVVKEAKDHGQHSCMVSVHNNAAGKGDVWKKAYGWSVWTTRGQNNSDKLAECMWQEANEILPPLGMKTRQDRTDGDNDYEAGFYILNGANCPAVLTENMFQDCVDEVKWMLTDEGFNALVDIHVRGIKKFIQDMGW